MSIITCSFLPSLHVQPFNRTKTRTCLYSSMNVAMFKNRDQIQTLLWDNNRRTKNHCRSTSRFIVRSVVEPGAPLPPEPPFNFLNWIVGIAFTVVLPFFSHKWTSLLKIKNEVDTVVEIAEEIVEVVEKVAEGVEKAAEDIAEDFSVGGGLRKAVDFVEHVAERANEDAHKVGDFIDKVQEVEEKVEEYVESVAEEATSHKHHSKVEEIKAPKEEEEDRTKEESIDEMTTKHY